MANLNGVNYAKSLQKPVQKLENGQLFGSIHTIREEYSLSGSVLAVNDVILGPKLPAGARVTSAKIKIDATLGTGGILDLGHLGSDSGNIAADADAFVSQADAGGAAVLKSEGAANVGIDSQFAESVQLAATVTEASSVSTGVKISFWLEYTLN